MHGSAGEDDECASGVETSESHARKAMTSIASRPFLAWTRRQIELLALACPHRKDVRSSCFPPAAAPIGDLGQERKARRRAASAPRGARRPEKTRSVRRRRGGPMDRRDAGATSDGRLIN